MTDDYRPISTAPQDGREILAVAIGADERPLYAIVRWQCRRHAFDARFLDCRAHPKDTCQMEWIGPMGLAYGVEFVAWTPVPVYGRPRRSKI